MRSPSLIILSIALLLQSTSVSAQAPPTTVGSHRPTLRRDRTQRVLYPRILQFEDERIVPSELLEMLNASHGGVKRRAILALGRIGSAAGISRLREILSVERLPDIRALTAFSLGEIESHYAAAELIERLDPAKENSFLVRGRAAEALGKIASNKVSAEALGKYGVKTISDLIAKLLPPPAEPQSDEARFVGSLALTALLRLKQSSAIDPIAAQLKSNDPELRWQAANALARIREGISGAAPALLVLLDDKEALVRAHAARTLGVMKEKSALDSLIRLLHDSDERVVVNSVNALGSIGDARAVDALVQLGSKHIGGYRSFDREKQGAPPQQNPLLLIATALGNLKDPRALPFLKVFRFADGRIGSNPEVEIAVAKFGEAAFFEAPESASLPKGDWKAMAAYAQGLGQLATDRARTVLLDLLSGQTYGKPDSRAVSDILNAMSAAKVAGLRDILLRQLKDADVIVRATAATLLGEVGDSSEEVITALAEAYKTARSDKMNDARIAILESSQKLKHPINVQALSEPTRDDDYVVRLKAAELLVESKEEIGGLRLQVGKVETGRDRSYWKRVGLLGDSPKNPVAIIHTRKGDIRLELFAQDAPMTVDNFIQLSRSGFYDGLTFMRVVPNFVIQGGDPRNDMNGGPGYQIRCEINNRPYGAGTVGMALSGKDTGGSQFFITHSPQPHLDGGYTVFGQVVQGMEVVNRMARGDLIEKVEIVEPKRTN